MAGEILYLQIQLDENGSVATVNNLGNAIGKTGVESHNAAGKVDQLSGSTLNAEANFKALGIKSSEAMNLMRTKITNAYDMITHSSNSTAKDILRAEEAKNAKLKELTEQQFGHQKTLIKSLKEHWIAAGAVIYSAMKFERMIEGWAKLAIVQDTVDRTLKAAMVTNNRYTEAFYQGTIKQAQALSRLTGMHDQNIERAQQMLMMYNNLSNDIMPRATKAVINMAAMMGGGEGSLQMAAISLGRSMEGMTEGLRRQGIVIDQSVFKQRGAIGILEEVEKKVSGQAEALAQGSGQWKILGTQVDEAKEGLGKLFNTIADKLGIIESLIWNIDKLGKLLDKLNKSNEPKGQFKKLAELEESVARNREENTKILGGSELSESLIGYLFGETAWQKQEKAIERFYQKRVTAILTRIASEKTQIDEFLESIKTTDQIAEESMKRIMDAAGNGEKWKDNTKEIEKAAKALEEVNDIIAKNTLSPYALVVYELDKQFSKLDETVRKSPEGVRAYGLALDELKRKFADTFKSALYAQVFDDSFFGKALKDARDYGQSIKLGNLGLGSLPPSKGQWSNLGFTGFSTELTANADMLAADATERMIKLELEQFEGLQKELEANYAYFSDLQIKQAEESRKVWDGAASSLELSFMGAFDNVYKDGLGAFKDLGKNGADVLVHAINQRVLAKPLESLAQGITGLFTSKQVLMGYEPNTGMPIMGTQKGALAGAAPYMAAGAMGYGVGGLGGALGGIGGYAGGAALAAGGGTLAGMTVAGPAMLAAAGIALGSFLTGAFKSKDVKIPNAKIIYEVVDGELKKISERWKNMSRDSGLVDSITSFFDAQITFYDHLSVVTGQKMTDLKLSVGGRGIGEVQSEMEKGMSAAVLKLALANYGQLSQAFGEGFTSQFEAMYGETFKPVKEMWGFKKETLNYPSLENVAGNLEEIKKLFDMYSKQNLGSFLFGSRAGGIDEMMSGIKGDEWKAILQPFIDQLNEIWGTFSTDLGSAFFSSLSTGAFADFEQQFKASIFKGVSESIAQAFMNTATEMLMGPESGIFASFSGAQNVLKDYISGKEGVTVQDVMSGFSSSFSDINQTMGELAPVWNEFNTGMQGLAQALGLNTNAVIGSTQQYSDSIDKFLADLSGGSLAPSQSMAGQMEQYNRLYTQALYDPSKSQELLSYVGSSYLQMLQGTSEDYAGAYAGVTGQIAGLPTAWGTPSDAVMNPVNPGDYSSGSVAGQTQGIGFEQAVKNALKEILGPMFLDLKGATEAPKQVSGDLNIKGSIGSLMVASIKSEPDVKAVVHNA